MTGISGGIAFVRCLVELTDYSVELDKLAARFGRPQAAGDIARVLEAAKQEYEDA